MPKELYTQSHFLGMQGFMDPMAFMNKTDTFPV